MKIKKSGGLNPKGNIRDGITITCRTEKKIQERKTQREEEEEEEGEEREEEEEEGEENVIQMSR